MNDSVTTPAGNGTNKPSHIAYQVRDGKDKGFWTRIGVAWTSRDEKGFVIQLNAIPSSRAACQASEHLVGESSRVTLDWSRCKFSASVF